MRNGSDLIAAFQARYHEVPRTVVRAPSAITLFGEQTDLHEGFALALAIDQATYVAASHRVDRLVRAYARPFDNEDRFALDTLEPSETRPWANYVRGVAKAFLARDLPIFGAHLLLDSDLPAGAGFGPTAQLAVGVGYALQLINNLSLLGEELALLALGVEQSFVGVQHGIAQHLAATLGQADYSMLIDCRDLSYRSVPLPEGVRLVLADTGLPDNTGSTMLAARRAECAEALRLLAPAIGGHVTALRDVGVDDLDRHAALLAPTLLARARHLVTENRRVLAAAEALDGVDLVRCGELLYESHASLRDDYQVSMPELDLLVELAHRQPGCYGARMSGVGPASKMLSLVNASSVETFGRSMNAAYQRETGNSTTITVCRAVEGVSRAGSS